MKNHVTIEQAFEICSPLQEVNDMTKNDHIELANILRDNKAAWAGNHSALEAIDDVATDMIAMFTSSDSDFDRIKFIGALNR